MLVTMYIRVFTEPHIKSLLFSKIKEFSLFHLIIVSHLVQNDLNETRMIPCRGTGNHACFILVVLNCLPLYTHVY